MSFIGAVNVLPNSRIFAPWQPRQNCPLFVRPHDIEIHTQPQPHSIPATVARLNHLGWDVQVEMRVGEGEGDQNLMGHLTRSQLASLNLKENQRVFITPRTTKSFENIQPQSGQVPSSLGLVTATK
jgi:sulfate transport system ATP-binding protein